MLRHITFAAAVTMLACSVASAQYPVAPFGSYSGYRLSPVAATTSPYYGAGYNYGTGYNGIRAGGCVGGNCPTGNCATGNCRTGNCAGGVCRTGNCPNGNCGSSGMVCGPNGCYSTGNSRIPVTGQWRNGMWVPNTAYRPVYNPSVYDPSVYRDRNLPVTGGIRWFPSVTGAVNPYNTYTGPGVLY
ncbi:MAG: hypothetical protein U0992_05965 [Planctomycetaceae bacterium]